MALYRDTYICPLTNSHCNIRNAVPEKIPAMKAFLNFTRALGISIYTAVKKSQIKIHEATSMHTVTTGERKLK